MCQHHHAEGIATFILGALIGAAVGVLYAPAKGETTRRKLKRWTEETYENGKEELAARTEELRDKFSTTTGKAKERAAELKEKLAEKAEDIKQRALESSEELRGKAADELEKAAEKLDKVAKKIR